VKHTLVSLLAFLALTASLTAQDGKSEIPADTDIQTTASGLKYSVLKAGKGPKAAIGDKVMVHYTGWLTNGTQFDSSRSRGNPFSFDVGSGVIAGWSEVVQLMSKGSRYKCTIPPALGYGGRVAGQIPPNSVLIFDIEVLDIISPPKFRKGSKEAQKTTKSGFRYEVLTPGTGEMLKKDQIFVLDYAIWTADGKLLQYSQTPERRITSRVGDMGMVFLQEAPLLMNLGARYRFEVPKKIGVASVPGETVWELSLVEIRVPLAVPEFAMSTPENTKVTDSGLKYEVIKEGKGKHPVAANTVRVHYAGWLTDGTLFDSSYGRAETAKFPLGNVIKGWTEGIQLMKPGGIFRFTIPGHLAYGLRGSPPKVGPNATLVFYVELKGIE
jgi:FKBP-type peptidyl-prolyl cis-trans isomerase